MNIDALENRVQQLSDRLREYRRAAGGPNGAGLRERIAELWGEAGEEIAELGVPLVYEASGRRFPFFEIIVTASPAYDMVIDESIGHALASLAQAKGKLSRIRNSAGSDQPAGERTSSTPSTSVFVVHGHDNALRESVARYLGKLGLQPVILHEQPNRGGTLIEKFEANAEVGFAVVLLTPDDFGYTKDAPETVRARARQNVVLELGFFWGRLSRSRVCVLYSPEVELPSDTHGIIYVPTNNNTWRLTLARELRAAGYRISTDAAVDTAG